MAFPCCCRSRLQRRVPAITCGASIFARSNFTTERKLCAELGDRYHQALCDLDESEIYLELNLTEGGTELAQDAVLRHSRTGHEV